MGVEEEKMGYCLIKGKMCELTTADGYCRITACKDHDEVIYSKGVIYVPFSKLKEYMADDDEEKENEVENS